MQEQRKYIRHKPTTYLIRDEIEEIVKKKTIDRNRFHEYSKSGYSDIIKKFYYGFIESETFLYKKDQLHYLWLHFRKELESISLAGSVNSSLDDNLLKITEYLKNKEDESFFLIISEGWVYEGYPDEMLSVLASTDDMLLEDFYIISPDFKWCIAYCDDGNCSVLYKKEDQLL